MRTTTRPPTPIDGAAPRLTQVIVDSGDGTLPARVGVRNGLIACRIVSRDVDVAEVALVAGGAMLLGGDHVRIEISVAAGCRLRLIDIGGIVAYDGEGRHCAIEIDIRLGEAAVLDWDALPTIVATGAVVARVTRVFLGAHAAIHLRETIVLGRAGETGGHIRVSTRIEDPEGPILVEQVDLDGGRPVPGVAAGARVMDAVIAAGAGHDALADAVAGNAPVPGRDGTRPTRLRFERNGTMLRWLGGQTHESPLFLPGTAHRAEASEETPAPAQKPPLKETAPWL